MHSSQWPKNSQSLSCARQQIHQHFLWKYQLLVIFHRSYSPPLCTVAGRTLAVRDQPVPLPIVVGPCYFGKCHSLGGDFGRRGFEVEFLDHQGHSQAKVASNVRKVDSPQNRVQASTDTILHNFYLVVASKNRGGFFQSIDY